MLANKLVSLHVKWNIWGLLHSKGFKVCSSWKSQIHCLEILEYVSKLLFIQYNYCVSLSSSGHMIITGEQTHLTVRTCLRASKYTTSQTFYKLLFNMSPLVAFFLPQKSKNPQKVLPAWTCVLGPYPPDQLGAHQRVVHGSAECWGSRLVLDPAPAQDHHTPSSEFDSWCHSLWNHPFTYSTAHKDPAWWTKDFTTTSCQFDTLTFFAPSL